MTRATRQLRTWAMVTVLLAALASAPALRHPHLLALFRAECVDAGAGGGRHRAGRLEAKLCGAGYDPPTTTRLCSPAEIAESGVKIMRYGARPSTSISRPRPPPRRPPTVNRPIPDDGREHKGQRDYADPPSAVICYRIPPFPASYLFRCRDPSPALVTYINITHGMGVTYWTSATNPTKLRAIA